MSALPNRFCRGLCAVALLAAAGLCRSIGGGFVTWADRLERLARQKA